MNPLYDRLFGRHAGQDTPFLQFAGGGILSHCGFVRRAAQIAGALTAAGLTPGDRLAAQVEKSSEALA
ncbi:MAG: malonyl-CoA synthase, partial [Silicimonas sp.]|nr:malonyl-CoA synthase [Silicimonas sp.]